MLSKEEIIQICRESLIVTKLPEADKYSFKLYFETVADKIVNRLENLVVLKLPIVIGIGMLKPHDVFYIPELGDVNQRYMFIDYDVGTGFDVSLIVYDTNFKILRMATRSKEVTLLMRQFPA